MLPNRCLERDWADLGGLWGRLEGTFDRLWAALGDCWDALGCLGAVLGRLGAVLGLSWGHLGSSWAVLGRLGADFGWDPKKYEILVPPNPRFWAPKWSPKCWFFLAKNKVFGAKGVPKIGPKKRHDDPPKRWLQDEGFRQP